MKSKSLHFKPNAKNMGWGEYPFIKQKWQKRAKKLQARRQNLLNRKLKK